jgi:hypothetical protein
VTDAKVSPLHVCHVCDSSRVAIEGCIDAGVHIRRWRCLDCGSDEEIERNPLSLVETERR